MTQLPCMGFNLTQQEEMEEGDEGGELEEAARRTWISLEPWR
jgi:hypothetical protein